MEKENSNLEDIIDALLKLQQLKIWREYDLASEAILMTFCFDTMQEIIQKRDQEIERIRVETEKELKKYKAKINP